MNPFGYQFGPFGDGSDTLPSGGQPLLDDVDQHTLDTFFDNTDPFDSKISFGEYSVYGKNVQHDFDGWSYQPPPIVQGVSTTVASHISQTPTLPNGHQHGHMNIPQSFSTMDALHYASEEDKQAASALQIFNNHQAVVQPSLDRGIPGQSLFMNLRPESTSEIPARHHSNYLQSPLMNDPLDLITPSMLPDQPLYLGNANTQSTQQYSPTFKPTSVSRPDYLKSYHFGSDSNFNSSGYMAPPEIQAEDTSNRAMKEEWVGNITANPGNIAPTSPSVSRRHINKTMGQIMSPVDGDDDDNDTEREEAPRPSKRRKSMATFASPPNKNSNMNSEGTAGSKRMPAATTLSKKQRKLLKEEDAPPPPNKPSSVSQANQAKAGRANLTEEEKRSNHILSEQKRRNLIKQGFEDLNHLVPELRSGGLSKSAVLTEAGNYLESLVTGNNELKRLLGLSEEDG